MGLYVDGNKCQRYIDKTCILCTHIKKPGANSKMICSYFIEANNKKPVPKVKRKRRGK